MIRYLVSQSSCFHDFIIYVRKKPDNRPPGSINGFLKSNFLVAEAKGDRMRTRIVESGGIIHEKPR